MTAPKTLTFLFFFSIYTSFIIAQSNAIGMTVVTEKITKEIKEISTAKSLLTADENSSDKYASFKAEIWPNPSNLGKVRLSVENLPGDPLFIQIFNQKEELVQEGVLQGNLGAKLEHTLTLPDAKGNYSIKLSNTHKILKDLTLEIL